MPPADSPDFSIGQKLETPYGPGVVQSTSRDHVTLFIRGRGSIKFQRSDLGGDSSRDAGVEDEAESRQPTDKIAEEQSPRDHESPGKSDEPEKTSGAHEPGAIEHPLPRPEAPEPTEPTPTSGPASGTDLDVSKRTKVRAALEALRLGTVPPFAVQETTISRTRQLGILRGTLADAKEHTTGRVILLTGPNGSGKTHSLRLLEQEALERGFVVAKSELEGATQLTPKDVYREAVMSLLWRSEGRRLSGDLQEFLYSHLDQLNSLEISQLSRSRVLYQLLDKLRTGEGVSAESWDFVHGDERYASQIEADGFKSTWLAFWKTAGQSLGNSMNGLAQLVRTLGYSGLVLLVDETELIVNQNVDPAIRGREWLRGLVLSAKGGSFRAANGSRFEEWDTRLYREWNHWPGQSIRQTRQEWALRYGGVHPRRDPRSRGNPLPYAPCGTVPLVLALGYTTQTERAAAVFDEADGYVESWLPEDTVENGILEMDPPGDDEIEELVYKIAKLYGDAYPGAEKRVRQGLAALSGPLVGLLRLRLRTGAAESIRWATQTIVETLDRLMAGVSVNELAEHLNAAA